MNGFETGMHLAKIYAQALFELAEQTKSIEFIKSDLDMVRDVGIQEKDFGALMESPYFTTEYKGQIVQKIFETRLSDLTMNFLMTAVRHERMTFLPQIIDRFNELRETRQGYRIVQVTISEPMSREGAERLSTDIAAAMKSKVKLQVSVNPSIIGGIIIRYGDKVIDNSLKGRLHRAVDTIINRQRIQEKADEV